MSFREDMPAAPRPSGIRAVQLPRRERYFPSPVDWRDEILYFLLPDRFSDGKESSRPLLNRANLPGARPSGFRFDRWAQSRGDRWQGGTINGIRSKLDYLGNLGITSLWDRTTVQTTNPSRYISWLCSPGLPGTGSAVRHTCGSGRPGRRRACERVAHHSGHHLQPFRLQLALQQWPTAAPVQSFSELLSEGRLVRSRRICRDSGPGTVGSVGSGQSCMKGILRTLVAVLTSAPVVAPSPRKRDARLSTLRRSPRRAWFARLLPLVAPHSPTRDSVSDLAWCPE